VWGEDDVVALSDVDGSVSEYSDEGSGPTIVLFHAGGFADWFLPTATILREQGFRVVRLRRAGYGDTAPPPALSLADHARHSAAALDHLGLRGSHVVGHSSGALVALELAAARPELVGRLTLFEPAPGGPLAPARPMDSGAPAAASTDDPFDAFMVMACGPDYLPVLTDALGSAGVERARLEGSYFLSDEMPAVLRWHFGDESAERITQPLTVAWGTKSSPAYREACHQLHGLIPHAVVVSVDGADHLYPLRDPVGFAALIREQAAA